jgi:chromosome segregation ATPase
MQQRGEGEWSTNWNAGYARCEEELNGERHVSRYMVEQAGRNSEGLHAVRAELAALRAEVAGMRADLTGVAARVDVLCGDMASTKAALTMHGRALDVLMQDVRQLRSGQEELRSSQEELRRGQEELRSSQEELRRGQEELQARLDRMQEEAAARHAELLGAIRVLGGGSPPA